MRTAGSNTLFFKLLLLAMLVMLIMLQVRLWFSEDGYREVSRLDEEVVAQKLENDNLGERNARLAADVLDLKSGNSAIEERARADLGMVEEDEDFFLFGEESAKSESVVP
ncbi:MAG: cell division protein FtsB [Chromatiales bacterium]|jgi:cell division protein FtsB|nr:cell division protein FtsB [Chromatiales bacterium]